MRDDFYVIVVDHDCKVCSIHGPLSDDRAWGVNVVDARRTGRNIQLVGGLALTSRALADAEARSAYRDYELVESALSATGTEST